MTNILERIINSKGSVGFFLKYILKKIPHKVLNCEIITRLKLSQRPEYAYCMYHAAVLAKKLNYKTISFIEFGVAGGNGLSFIENFSNKISQELNIEIQIYGFTSKSGMPKPLGYTDLPYWFKQNLYKTDDDLLKSKISKSKIIYGDVKKTCKNFFFKYKPAPIAAIFNDLDYFSSTKDSFFIFNGDQKFFLPRIFCYFDDVVGTENEMYSDFTGELLAIHDFNKKNKFKKITRNYNLVATSSDIWRFQIFYYHNFKHYKYNQYIAKEEQIKVNKNLKLKK